MDDFRGIKARLEEMGVKSLSRRARKRARKRGKHASVDLSTLTPAQAKAFLALLDGKAVR